MDQTVVYSQLLRTLAASPLWAWHAAPSVWAVAEDDPPILVIAFAVPTVEALTEIAQQWRIRSPGGSIPAVSLCLVHEGVAYAEGAATEVRDLVAVHRDGDIVYLRWERGGDEVEVLDPEAVDTPALTAMREVGASAWP